MKQQNSLSLVDFIPLYLQKILVLSIKLMFQVVV